MPKPDWAYLAGSKKERERMARRYDRLVRTEPYLDKAVLALGRQGTGWPRAVRVRRDFVYRKEPPTADASDRALPPPEQRPPATRLLKANLALRFYLIALCAAQMRTRRVGTRPANDLPLIATGGDVGWIDLVALPVEPKMDGKVAVQRSSKKQRQVISALQKLSDPGVQLVHLPNENKRYDKYQGFQLLDEGGVRDLGDPAPYVIPLPDAKTFTLPSSLFSNGWIHLLEDAELAFLMMLTAVTQPGREWVKISSGERLLHYGIGRDTYAAYKTLRAFGLLNVEHDEGRHSDGKVRDYNQGAKPRLDAFKLEPDGFEEPALDVMKGYLGQFGNRPAG